MSKTPSNTDTESSGCYRGRFAPSPTGPLHFGSLVAALASFLDAKHFDGEWLVRIEDIDPPRVIPGSADGILRDLESFGMCWDCEIIYQSNRDEIYHEYLEKLTTTGLVYPCTCSRREIADSAVVGIDGPVYPGTCRNESSSTAANSSLRVDTTAKQIQFNDLCHGMMEIDLEQVIGDFNVRRSDGLWAYQFAVVVDDAVQGITQVVRGADLLFSTPRQIHLQQLLGLPTPLYMHIPVVLDEHGGKLSKQMESKSIQKLAQNRSLCVALEFLGHPPPTGIRLAPAQEILAWAITSWQPKRLSELDNRSVIL